MSQDQSGVASRPHDWERSALILPRVPCYVVASPEAVDLSPAHFPLMPDTTRRRRLADDDGKHLIHQDWRYRITWEVKTASACSARKRTSFFTRMRCASKAFCRPRKILPCKAKAAAGRAARCGGCASIRRARSSSRCNRDGVRESYLNPSQHRVGVRLEGENVSLCNWHFELGDGSVHDVRANCGTETQVEEIPLRPIDRSDGGDHP